MRNCLSVRLDPDKGAMFEDAATEAIFIATLLSRDVVLVFNLVRLNVTSDDTPETLASLFQERFGKPE